MTYLTRDNRIYRMSESGDIEIWNPFDEEWEPYLGDAARVIVEANPISRLPEGVTP